MRKVVKTLGHYASVTFVDNEVIQELQLYMQNLP